MVKSTDNSVLYREPSNGKIFGVCAGLGRYFGIETWWVRIITVSVFLLGGGILVLFAYIGLALMLDKRPASMDTKEKTEFDHAIKNKPWKQGQAPSALLQGLDKEFAELEMKIREMEAYVTSDAHKVNREFSKL